MTLIKAVVSYVKPQASVTYSKATVAASSVTQNFIVQFQDIRSVLTYVAATATDVTLDPSSLNQWFRDETFSITDATPTITYNKNFAHTITFSESLSSAVTFVRSPSESFTVSESPSYSFVTSKADSFSTSDSPTWSFNGNYTESVTVTDAATYLFEKPAVDSFGVTDAAPSFEIALTQGAIADSFTVTEQPNFSVVLSQFSDSFSVSESITAGLLVPINASDAFSISESASIAIGFGRNASDSFSVSESISAQLVIGTSSQFNKSAFNVAQLNQ